MNFNVIKIKVKDSYEISYFKVLISVTEMDANPKQGKTEWLHSTRLKTNRN